MNAGRLPPDAAPQRIQPIGWVVESAKGRALILERPAADLLAARVHGTVDAAYSGAQVNQMLELAALALAAAAQHAAAWVPPTMTTTETPPCSRP